MNNNALKSKLCRKCETVLETTKFYTNLNCPDGLEPWCRECKLAAAKLRRAERIKNGLCVCGKPLSPQLKKCNTCREREKNWATKFPEKKAASQQNYMNGMSPVVKINRREYQNTIQRNNIKSYQNRVFDHYGRSCECCQESNVEVLTIDHVNGGGSKHRKEIKMSIYAWLVKNSFPAGFRTLCILCNWSLGVRRKCYHQTDQSPHGDKSTIENF